MNLSKSTRENIFIKGYSQYCVITIFRLLFYAPSAWCWTPMLKPPLAVEKVGNQKLSLQNLSVTSGFANRDNFTRCLNLTQRKRTCQDTTIGLLNLILDPQELDGQVKLTAILTPKTFMMKVGKYSIKEINIENIKMPLETVDDSCFAIRSTNIYPNIICAPSRAYRNYWINSIHEAILCNKNRNVDGSLPLYPGPELITKAQGIQDEEIPSSINIHLDKAPHLGNPELLINGHPVDLIIKEEKRETNQLIQARRPKTTTDGVIAQYDENIQNVDEDLPNQAIYSSPALSTLLAINESKAEKLEIPATDAPSSGYIMLQRRVQNQGHIIRNH